MGINAGANAITGVYLGDQLLTKGGGDVESIIQSAIDKPDAVILGQLLASPDQILSSTDVMTAIANSEAAMDLIVPTGVLVSVLADYPTARSIYYNSPYIGKYPPGRATLAKGTQSCGYYGKIPAIDFGKFTVGSQAGKMLTASTLAAALSITSGSAMNENTTWHKFNWENQIWYIASKAIRYSISWDIINTAKAVFGGTSISTTRGKFLPYLLTGGVYNDSQNIGSGGNNMWDKLLRPLLSGGFWGTNYTDAQLDFSNSDNGHSQWCQENNGGLKQLRYGPGGASALTYSSSASGSGFGWRPALRFVP